MQVVNQNETAGVREDAANFLANHKKMILTVLDREKHPNSSLVLYVADDFTIYFGTRKSYGKYAALTANPNVAVAVVQESIDPLQVLDIQGIAEEVPGTETQKTVEWFTEKNSSKFFIKDAEDLVMFKIKPLCIRWLNATSGDFQVCDIGV